jgi:acetyl esterase/lipase
VAWLLTATAFALVLAVAALAAYMATPVDYDGRGRYAVFALLFPLHLFVISAASAGLAAIAWFDGAVVAVVLFGAAVILTMAMALWPTVAMWRYARHHDVTPSLRTYAAHAFEPNYGRPQAGRTVVYGTAPDGTALELDAWPLDAVKRANARNAGNSGDAASRHPVVVQVHGGGWVGGGRGAEAWNQWLNGLGFVVFDVDYRLPPPERWRDEVGDVKAALGWVAEHAADYHVDPGRISVMGDSAGANLAMLAAYSANDSRLPPSCGEAHVTVRCVINLYGPADLTSLSEHSGSRRYIQECLRAYIGGGPEDHPDRYRLISPIQHLHGTVPPTLTLLGHSDRIVPAGQALALDGALDAAGVPHETYLLPGNDHGFDTNWGGFGTQFAQAKVQRFLERHG